MFPLLSCVLLVLFIICQAGFVEEIAQEIIESPNVEDDTSIAGTHESRDREARLHSGLLYWIAFNLTWPITKTMKKWKQKNMLLNVKKL